MTKERQAGHTKATGKSFLIIEFVKFVRVEMISKNLVFLAAGLVLTLTKVYFFAAVFGLTVVVNAI